jgi:hypothetical protein
MMYQKDNDVKCFGVTFEDAAVRSGVPEATSKWYVMWARKLISFASFQFERSFFID